MNAGVLCLRHGLRQIDAIRYEPDSTIMMPITDLINYYGPLHDDVERCLVGIEIGEDIEYWKRSYLRCLCTFVEARVFLLKMEMRAPGHLAEASNFSTEAIGFLCGTEWNVDSSGEIKSKIKLISPVSELKAVIKLLGSIYPSLRWDFESERWSRVKDLFNARNALVHPKNPAALSVATSDIKKFEIFRAEFNEWSRRIYVEAWGSPRDGF